jgi:hypothetical protein
LVGSGVKLIASSVKFARKDARTPSATDIFANSRSACATSWIAASRGLLVKEKAVSKTIASSTFTRKL